MNIDVSRFLYSMKLYERIECKFAQICRVPGGWIYNLDFNGGSCVNTVFVPFDNEFQEDK